MILDIDDFTKPEKPKLYIATPNRTIVGELPEAYNVQLGTKLGNVPTLDFSIPYRITKMNRLIDNPNVQKTKNRYLIKFVQGSNIEWFMIKTPTDVMDNTDHKDIQCYGAAYELADKNVRNYEVTSKNVTQILTTLLASSLWSIGTVDADFDVMYRSISVTDSNVLDVIFEVAATFDALVTFDSVNRKVNFVQFSQYGLNKGLEVSYGNLLKNATKTESTDEFFTLFKGFGADGIGIQSVNVTGSNYLFDVSFFMYPFARDESGNILAHSEYMSDELCHALLDYRELLESSSGTYQGYLAALETLNQTLVTKQNELFDLQSELAVIEDQIAVANYNGDSTAVLVSQKNAKMALITAKNSEINAVQSDIDDINDDMNALQSSLSMSANLSSEQLEELNPYIIEGSYENTNVTSAQQLYDILVKEFEKVKQPKIIVEIDMVNLLEIAEEKKKWDMLRLGDTVSVKNTRVGIHVTAKIIELNFDFESGEISVVVSNVKELLSDEARFLRDLYNAKTTTTNVISNSGLWNQAADEASEAQQILNGVWDATARQIQASVDNTVDIGRKGVIVRDPNTPDDILILQKGLLAISRNGGDTWSTAINADGVFAERLVGQILVGENLFGENLSLSNTSGSVNIDADGMTITDMNLTVTRSDNKSRVKISGIDGIKIQSSANGTTWVDRLSADANGNLIADSLTTNKLIMKNGNDVLINAETRVIDFSKFTTKIGTITAANIDATNLHVSSANIDGAITANSLVAFASITSPTIYGGSVYSPYISSQSGAYPRVELNSVENSFSSYYSSDNYVKVLANNAGSPTINLRYNSGLYSYIGIDYNYDRLLIQCTKNIEISAGSNIKFPNWSKLYNADTGQSLQTALNSVVAKFA